MNPTAQFKPWMLWSCLFLTGAGHNPRTPRILVSTFQKPDTMKCYIAGCYPAITPSFCWLISTGEHWAERAGVLLLQKSAQASQWALCDGQDSEESRL